MRLLALIPALLWSPAHSWAFVVPKTIATRSLSQPVQLRLRTTGTTTAISAGAAAQMDDSSSSLEGKDIYQRVFYRFSPGSDVAVHNAVIVEERCRFGADPDRTGYILPMGPRTLILRDGQVEDGEIGDDFFTINVSAGSGDGTHNGGGNDLEVQAAIACAMYLASNPDLCRGRMLELSCNSGLASLLGCIGAGYTQGVRVKDSDLQDDILTMGTNKKSLLPADLDVLVMTDVDEDRLTNSYHNLKVSGVSGSKVSMEVLDWRARVARPRGSAVPVHEYRTIVGSDLVFSYPETKELARAVAHRLEPTEPFLYAPGPLPRFVHVCPDDRSDLPYLRRILEKGYRMATSTHYLKLEKLIFHFQTLPAGEPETALDDLELEMQAFKEIKYESLIAQHHPDYAGQGSGELFFPMETGEYETTGGSTFLEKESGSSPW